MNLERYKDLPGYAKLNDEQKKTADRWDREREQHEKVFTKLDQAMKEQNEALYREALDDLGKTADDAYMCEHERHWSSHCAACDEVEKILRPELYCHDEDCGYQLEPEEVEAGETLCEYCRDKEDN